MPIFKPFRGIRPNDDYVEIFPTHPIDGLSQEVILKKSQENNTYIQMIKPYILSKSKDVDRNLRKIRHSFEDLLENKVLTQDASSYYLYEQIYPNKSVFRGLLGLTSVEDFWNGKIKRHESTIPQKKEKLAHYLEKVNLQSDPVLLTYPSNPKVELLMNHEEKSIPILSFEDDKGIKHKLWQIDNRLKMQQLKEVLDNVEAFYIADGHHRIGSAALNAKKQKEKNKKHTGLEAYNFVYSFIVSNQSIKIHDYNRVVKDLNRLSPEDFLKQLEVNFNIHEKDETLYFPSQKFHISMYMGGKFYSLHLKHSLRTPDMVKNLIDHQVVDNLIFNDILNIENTDSSDNINYIKGTSSVEGIKRLKDAVDSGKYAVAFGIYPVSFNEMIKISDNKISMPPKCTYIEPKLMSALVMYDIK